MDDSLKIVLVWLPVDCVSEKQTLLLVLTSTRLLIVRRRGPSQVGTSLLFLKRTKFKCWSFFVEWISGCVEWWMIAMQ